MQITALPNIVYRAASNRPPELSPTAAVRLKLLEQWRAFRAEGATAARAAGILRVPRANLYRWEARLNERGLRGLEPGSRRPRNSRKPQRDPALVKAVLDLRAKPPCYGKNKIAVELRKDGWAISASMAERILSDAKRRGTLREPPRPGVRRRNPRPLRGHRTRVEEFYNFYDGELTMGPLNRALREWEARSSTRIGVSRLAGGLRWSILRSGAWRRPPNPLLSHMCRTSTVGCVACG